MAIVGLFVIVIGTKDVIMLFIVLMFTCFSFMENVSDIKKVQCYLFYNLFHVCMFNLFDQTIIDVNYNLPLGYTA